MVVMMGIYPQMLQTAILGLAYHRFFATDSHKLVSPAMVRIIALLATIHFVFFITQNRMTAISGYGFNYDMIMKGQVYRMVTGALLHYNLAHLLANVLGLMIIGRIKCVSFLNEYLTILLIIVCNSLIEMLIIFLLRLCGYPRYGWAIGFSGVVFALDVLRYYYLTEQVMMGIFSRLFISQMMQRNVSFIGHLAGIISGLVLSYKPTYRF